MPLRSLKNTLWRRLYTKFDILASIMPGLTHVGEVVVPVTDVDKLLKTLIELTGNTVHGAGTSERKFLGECPKGKRWAVQLISYGRSAGDNTLSNIELKRGVIYIKIHKPATPDVSGVVPLYQPISMEQAEQLHVTSAAVGVAGTTFTTSILIEEEDAY